MHKGPGDVDVFSVTADIDGCVVRAEGHWMGTKITCSAPGAVGLWFRCYRGHVYPIARALGVQDLETGHAQFDSRFIVKGADPDYVRVWLAIDALRHLLMAPDYAIDLADEALTAELRTLEFNPEVLASAMRGLAVLGRRGTALRDEWTDLASQLRGRVEGAACWRADGRAWIAVEHAATACIIDSLHVGLEKQRAKLYTRVRARGVPDDMARARLPEQFADLAPEFVLVEDGHVAVYLPGFERSASRLTSALSVAAALAGDTRGPPSHGPFR